MKSICLSEFWSLYHKLPVEIISLADKKYLLFATNPYHPSLQFKPIKGQFWSVRIGQNYRAVGKRNGDEIAWFWIGTHAEYDQICRSIKI